MTFDELLVLIPCHSLEDFPTELAERPAEGLLNSFAVLWHPVLLAMADSMPHWRRADEVPQLGPGKLVILPDASQDWVGHAWADEARSAGAHVVTGIAGRSELVAAVLQPLESTPPVAADVVADFFALGSCYLQTELLTRHMRNFSHVDEVRLQREAVAAAKAALLDDRVAVETHLGFCFEMLLEARERFYPVDCFLIDLCLLTPRQADSHFDRLLDRSAPFNLLATAQDWSQIARERPDLLAKTRTAWHDGKIELIGGEQRETCTPLLSFDALCGEFAQGLETYCSLFGRRPVTWGRRRFGLDPYLPQLIARWGLTAGLHLVLDDGLYPDQEHSKLRWSGCDGTVIDAVSRIPLAADSASNMLRLPVRMAESMDQDQTAAIVFARWPEQRTPWLEDLWRAHRFSPVLGRFATFSQFFASGGMPGKLIQFKSGDYLSPFLVQSVAREQADPISRYVHYWSRRSQFQSLEWSAHLAELLRCGRIDAAAHAASRETIARADPEASDEIIEVAAQTLAQLAAAGPTELAAALASDASRGEGFLVANPLSFARKVVVEWPADAPLPAADAPVLSRQCDERRRRIVVDVPPCGFAWVANPTTPAEPPRPAKTAMAEDLTLRNELLEVTLSEATGGIGQVRAYRKGGNRLSQQLAFRFPRERTILVGAGDNPEEYRSYYSEMRLREARVLSAGPAVGEIETHGLIWDQQKNEELAEFWQRTRVCRGRSTIEIDIALDVKKMPDGDPWSNYIGARFAWRDESLVLSRSVHGGAHAVGHDRIEAPQYVELANEEQRTAILTQGLPFHRKTGPRMLDTLLVVAGETRRRFQLGIAVDVPFPIQAALDVQAPPLCVPTRGGPPLGATSGWLFHVAGGNVQLLRLLPLPATADNGDSPPVLGVVLRLMETEGIRRLTRVHCFRTPASARSINFLGETMQALSIEDDAIRIELQPHQVCDIEVRFA